MPISEFCKNKSECDGLHHSCKDCSAERYKKYYKNNKEKLIAYQKRYYEDNKKDILEKLKNINQEYNHLLKQDDEALITIHQDNYKEYQEYIFSIIHKTLMNLPPDDTYRKRDLLKSIERKHQL